MIDGAPRGRPLATLASAVLLAALASPAAAITPVTGTPAAFEVVEINLGPGDQYDPHVSGDLVSYTSDSTIRYYDFLTGVDREITPLPGMEDQLSAIDGDLIVFTRFDPGTFEAYVQLYSVSEDVLGSVPVGPDPEQHTTPSVGGTTVAYTELLSTDLFATRLGGSTSRITNDFVPDYFPAVAPSGDLLVWVKCPNGSAACGLWQAAWDGAAWQASSLTSAAIPGPDPSTDGAIVAYQASLSGEQDIYWQPVGGGLEQRIELPGIQSIPSVAHGLVSFASAAHVGAVPDIYLYEVASNRLFQITSTPFMEQLADVDVLADGRVRMVWTTGPLGDRDVYGVTMELPPVGPTYEFRGFASPVDAMPTLNQLKAGAAVPVKFSLGGDEGLAIFAAGYPKSQSIACDATAPVDGVEETVSAGGSSLTYDPVTGLYAYVWKTDRTWAGTCRQLVLVFADGSSARASFKFK